MRISLWLVWLSTLSCAKAEGFYSSKAEERLVTRPELSAAPPSSDDALNNNEPKPLPGATEILEKAKDELLLPIEAPRIEGLKAPSRSGRKIEARSLWIKLPAELVELEEMLRFSREKTKAGSRIERYAQERQTFYCLEYGDNAERNTLQFLWTRFAIFFGDKDVEIGHSTELCAINKVPSMAKAEYGTSVKPDYNCAQLGSDRTLGIYENLKSGGLKASLKGIISERGEPVFDYLYDDEILRLRPYRSYGETFAGEVESKGGRRVELRCTAHLN